ncbi:hypothetical protein [Methyloceanibacter superfactus]|nr:hypothetical protein [Methyloceanibacter superfactus]
MITLAGVQFLDPGFPAWVIMAASFFFPNIVGGLAGLMICRA